MDLNTILHLWKAYYQEAQVHPLVFTLAFSLLVIYHCHLTRDPLVSSVLAYNLIIEAVPQGAKTTWPIGHGRPWPFGRQVGRPSQCIRVISLIDSEQCKLFLFL